MKVVGGVATSEGSVEPIVVDTLVGVELFYCHYFVMGYKAQVSNSQRQSNVDQRAFQCS